MGSEIIDPEHYCGALKSPDDPSDWVFEHLAHGPPGTYISTFPDEFDLRESSGECRDQGDRGTCAAFTASSIKEIQEKRDCNFEGYMSPEFIYYHRDNKPSSGMYGRNVFQILQKIGSIPESLYPYKGSDAEVQEPSAEHYRLARKYRIANYTKVTTVDGLKRALLELGPCYLLLPLYSTNAEFWREVDGVKCNGHAVTVVGYTLEGFILRNSWGSTWNDAGYVIFPFDEWGCQWECWASLDEKTEMSIIKSGYLNNSAEKKNKKIWKQLKDSAKYKDKKDHKDNTKDKNDTHNDEYKDNKNNKDKSSKNDTHNDELGSSSEKNKEKTSNKKERKRKKKLCREECVVS